MLQLLCRTCRKVCCGHVRKQVHQHMSAHVLAWWSAVVFGKRLMPARTRCFVHADGLLRSSERGCVARTPVGGLWQLACQHGGTCASRSQAAQEGPVSTAATAAFTAVRPAPISLPRPPRGEVGGISAASLSAALLDKFSVVCSL
jgi:hypothetical protein